jgi:predicted nucleotide-binding protein (sugar kinase/HSP70/actin superfamily)
MTTTTTNLENYFITTDEDGDWAVTRLDDNEGLGSFETKEEAMQAAAEDRDEIEAQREEEEEESRRQELVDAIANRLDDLDSATLVKIAKLIATK